MITMIKGFVQRLIDYNALSCAMHFSCAQDNSMFYKNNWLCKLCTSSIIPFNHADENE